MSRPCAWFQCPGQIDSDRIKTRFCSSKCRDADANWRGKRGKTVVNYLMDWRSSRRWGSARMTAYVAKHGGLPLTLIELIVDGWISEKKDHVP